MIAHRGDGIGAGSVGQTAAADAMMTGLLGLLFPLPKPIRLKATRISRNCRAN